MKNSRLNKFYVITVNIILCFFQSFVSAACSSCSGGGSDGGGTSYEVHFINLANNLAADLETQQRKVEEVLEIKLSGFRQAIQETAVECAMGADLKQLRLKGKQAWFTSKANRISIDCDFWRNIKILSPIEKQVLLHEYMRKSAGETSAYQISQRLLLLLPSPKKALKLCEDYHLRILPNLEKAYKEYSVCALKTYSFLENNFLHNWPHGGQPHILIEALQSHHYKILDVLKALPLSDDGFYQENPGNSESIRSWREELIARVYSDRGRNGSSSIWAFQFSDMSQSKFFHLKGQPAPTDSLTNYVGNDYDLYEEVSYAHDLQASKPVHQWQVCTFLSGGSLGFCTFSYENVQIGADSQKVSQTLSGTWSGPLWEMQNRPSHQEIFQKGFQCDYSQMALFQFHNKEPQRWISVFGGWRIVTFEDWLKMRLEVNQESDWAKEDIERFKQCHIQPSQRTASAIIVKKKLSLNHYH